MTTENNNKIAKQKAKDAHEFLGKFLNQYDKVKRGGLHDIMETLVAVMIQTTIDNVDKYLKSGHNQVSGNEVMAVTFDSFQRVLDNAKRGLDSIKEVGME